MVEWVKNQRHDYSLRCGGDKNAMTAEHEAKLNVLGFLWEKRESPLVASNDNNVLCPDEVTSEREKRKSPAGSNESHVFCPDEVTSEGPRTKKAKHQP
jgi:hypothetical protein